MASASSAAAQIDGDAWVKLLLPPGEDGLHEHHGFKWRAPGLNVDTEQWSKEDCIGGLHLTRRRDIGFHLDLHGYKMTHMAPVLEIPEDARVLNTEFSKKIKVSSVVLGEAIALADVIGFHAWDASYLRCFTWVAHHGDLPAVVRLIKPDETRKMNYAIITAAARGHLHVVDYLKTLGADVNDSSVLDKAAAGGHLDVVNYVLKRGANPKNPYALQGAARYNHVEVVALLIDAGADPNNDEALSDAASNGHLDVVSLLLARGTNFNKKIPLFWAAYNGHLDVVNLLIENCDGEWITSALVEACYGGHLRVVEYLANNGGDPTQPDAVYSAVSRGHIDVFDFLIAEGADPKHDTAFYNACYRGDLPIMRRFIELGTDPNCENALDRAVMSGNIDAVSLLLEKGADPEKLRRLHPVFADHFSKTSGSELGKRKTSADSVPRYNLRKSRRV
jgi:ankyrin repeat protein